MVCTLFYSDVRICSKKYYDYQCLGSEIGGFYKVDQIVRGLDAVAQKSNVPLKNPLSCAFILFSSFLPNP